MALSQIILENSYVSNINIPLLIAWAENLNKLFTFLGRKFKFSVQDSVMEYLCWRCKTSPVSSDLKPPLAWLNSKMCRICISQCGAIKRKPFRVLSEYLAFEKSALPYQVFFVCGIEEFWRFWPAIKLILRKWVLDD